MLSDIVNAIESFDNAISEYRQKTYQACEILPPVNSVPSLFANLPVIILYIITLPIRFLLCPLLNTIGNPLCLLYNLVPPLGIINALTPTYDCLLFNCTNCTPIMINPFEGCQGNVFDYVYCTLGGALLSVVNPIISVINGLIKYAGFNYCLPYFSPAGCTL